MQQVKKGDKVKVHYHGRLEDGTTFDSSEGRHPLEFEVGSGTVIPGFDYGVAGMSVGEKKNIHIPFDEAYGERNEDLFIEFPKSHFLPDMKPEVGITLNMTDEKGQSFPAVIYEITDDSVILDTNHPLAGQNLLFDLELVEITPGSPLIIIP